MSDRKVAYQLSLLNEHDWVDGTKMAGARLYDPRSDEQPRRIVRGPVTVIAELALRFLKEEHDDRM